MSIVLHNLAYTHSDHTPLFLNLSLGIPTGSHVSLIGDNGAGKSTLLQLMAGRLKPVSGSVITSSRPWYVPQLTTPPVGHTLADALGIAPVLQALQAALAGEATPELLDVIGDQWDLEERAQEALAAWDMEGRDLQAPLVALSGGEQTRVALAALSLHQPAIMLLDEPTNHLDGKGRAQLAAFLAATKATLVLVSHDRALLDQNHLTVELARGSLTTYGGNYSFYKAERAAMLEALQQDLQNQAKELRQAKATAQHTRERQERQTRQGEKQTGMPKIVKNTLRNQAERSAARLKEVHADKLEGMAEQLATLRTQLGREMPLLLRFPDSQLPAGKRLIKAEGLNHQFGETLLWDSPLSLELVSGTRMAISGPNGAGKTTLLHLLLGFLSPVVGTVERTSFRSLYLDQQYSLLNPQLPVTELLASFNQQGLQPHELNTLLHQHRLHRELWDKPVASLSGGEKLKLALCCLSVNNQPIDLLVLDEPTNNLDVSSLEVLVSALQAYRGTVLVISHDVSFLVDIGITERLELRPSQS